MNSIQFKYFNHHLNDILTFLSSKNIFTSFTIFKENDKSYFIPTIGNYTYVDNDYTINISIEENTKQFNINQLDYIITLNSDNLNTFLKLFNNTTDTINISNTSNSFVYSNQNKWIPKKKSNKTFDTIYLKENIKEDIITKLDNFTNTEDYYIQYQQPYKYNIMLHGLPGTGKTSTTYAISNYLNKNTYFVNLFDYHSDNHFIEYINLIDENSIIVIEDIDCSFQNKKPEDIKRNNISMSCILNLLDGYYTKYNTIIIITANDTNNIDNSLLRPLRIDTTIEFNSLDQYQCNTILNKFLTNNIEDISNIILQKDTTHSYLIKFLFDYRNSNNILNDFQNFY